MVRILNRINLSGLGGASLLLNIDCISFRMHAEGLEKLVEALINSKSNKTVTTLKLGNNDIGDEGQVPLHELRALLVSRNSLITMG